MPRLDKQDWLRGAAALAAEGGIAAVKVEPLAKTLGVTKGSFYHHFDDRPALLDALLILWTERDTDQIIELVESGSEANPTPIEALHRLIDLTLNETTELDGVETAIREWAATDESVAATVAEIDARRLSYVSELLVELGVDAAVAEGRADVLYRIMIGDFLWRRYGGKPVDTAAVHAYVDWAATS